MNRVLSPFNLTLDIIDLNIVRPILLSSLCFPGVFHHMTNSVSRILAVWLFARL